MESCPSDLSGQEASLMVPSGPTFMGLVLDFSEDLARLAGFGPHGAGHCRLLAEEIFGHITQECACAGPLADCRLEGMVTADGPTLCFTTDHLTYDPQQTPEYSLDAVLAGQEPEGLGLHLVRQYAQAITLTRKGPQGRLCLNMARDSLDQGARAWSLLVPSHRIKKKLVSMVPRNNVGRVKRNSEAMSGPRRWPRLLSKSHSQMGQA